MTLEGSVKYPAAFLAAMLVSMAVTPWIMKLAAKIGMVDQPDERRIHKHPVPRGGGLAVFLGFHAACLLTYFWPWGEFLIGMDLAWWLRFLPLSALLVVIGFMDDRWGIPPWIKLGSQAAVAIGAFLAGLRFNRLAGVNLPWALDLAITVFWILALVNAFNLIDGMDGLAAGLGSIAAMGLAGSFLVSGMPGDCLILLGLMGACVGFLRYNFHPARIFMGDTGSMFIGFTLAAASLHTSTKSTAAAAIIVPLLAVGVPIFDTFLAVWRRLARRFLHWLDAPEAKGANVRVFVGDLDHLHHRLLRTGWSQRRVAMALYLASALLIGVGLAAVSLRSLSIGIYMVGFVAASYVVVRHVVHVELWDSANALARGLELPPRRWLAVPLYLTADVAILFLAHAIGHVLATGHAGWVELRHNVFPGGLFHAGIPFIALAAGGVYRRVWSRARVIDYFYLVLLVAAGEMLGTGIAGLVNPDAALQHMVTGATVLALGTPGLLFIRLFKRVVQEGVANMGRWYRVDDRLTCALVYGAGNPGIMFVIEEEARAQRYGRRFRLAGFLDDDANLHGRRVRGFDVLGGIEHAEECLGRTGARAIIVTEDLEAETARRLGRIAAVTGISVHRWRTTIEDVEGPKAEA